MVQQRLVVSEIDIQTRKDGAQLVVKQRLVVSGIEIPWTNLNQLESQFWKSSWCPELAVFGPTHRSAGTGSASSPRTASTVMTAAGTPAVYATT